jgi:radical SAM superfamily enzyme YgiQ (UPF0313 family)
MKVVLVNPRVLDTPNHPLGILYLAAYLEEAGHQVKVIDPDFGASAASIARDVLATKPDAVGIGSTTPQYLHAIDIAENLKTQSDLPLIMGGVHPTVLPQDVLREKCVDYVVVGEAEETFRELLETLWASDGLKDLKGIGYKEGNRLIFTEKREPIENLDELPFPARHLLPSRWYFAPPRIRGVWTNSTATVMASRGCPYQCIYCSSHLMFGRRVRYRTPKNIMAELRHLRNKYNIDAVWFADDTFTVNSKWVIELCELLKNEKWEGFCWACQARVNTVSRELLAAMKEAGCVQLDFGVESGSPRILKVLKKNVSPEQIENAFMISKEVGLLRFASYIIGTPGETHKDIQLTYELNQRIQPDYADFFFAVPYPGTELYELAEKHGVFSKGVSFNEWLLTKHTDKPVMCTDLSEEELIEWRTKLHNSNFWRNYSNLAKSPQFILGGTKMFFKGLGGLRKGLSRFSSTRKVDSIFVEVLKHYRLKTKKEVQTVS